MQVDKSGNELTHTSVIKVNQDATKGNKPGRESSALCLGAWSGADAASGAVLGASRRMDDVLLRVQA